MASKFVDAVLSNAKNYEIIRRLPLLGLPDCWLVAGSLFQAVWNGVSGRPPETGVKDYDIFYFESADLSYDAEDRAITRASAILADLGIAFDLKNQARVHLWYERHFGQAYPRLFSARDGIDRFLVAGTCIGIGPGFCTSERGGSANTAGSMLVDLYAPFGLDDAFDGVLRPNPLNADSTTAFARKAASYQARWPHLTLDSSPPPLPDRGRHFQVALSLPAPNLP